jgi:NADH:quinone reductase (non-electrogenic)
LRTPAFISQDDAERRVTVSGEQHRIVIVGGGFGGLHAALALKRAAAQVTLVDRRNYHLFQPLLYQVATGGLSPANIAAPLRAVLRKQRNCDIVLDEVLGFDVPNRRVRLRNGGLDYDTLIVAAGSRTSYFGHNDWERLAPGLKSVEDATGIRRRILLAFEAADRESDPERRRQWLTFVLIGGGPTGVELAGALGEISRHSLRHDFRHIDPAESSVVIIEAEPRILGTFPEDLSAKATKALQRIGVTVRTQTRVTEIHADRVVLSTPTGTETLETRTVLWSAGVRASELATSLANATGCEADRGGRILVEPDFSIPGHPDVFVIGDMACYKHAGDRPLPGVAPVAIQEGKYVAKLIRRRLAGKTAKPFRYWDYGNLATIGRSAAVAQFGRLKFSGFIAWMLWLFVHLMKLVQFQNRVLVFVQWAWNYLTFNRAARLITGELPDLPTRDDQPPANHEPHQTPSPAGKSEE